MSDSNEEMVLVSKAELERLRKLEAEMPAIIEKAKHEGGMDRLKTLHKEQKENPQKHREQALRYYNLRKDEINAKKRAAYKAKKEAGKIADVV